MPTNMPHCSVSVLACPHNDTDGTLVFHRIIGSHTADPLDQYAKPDTIANHPLRTFLRAVII